jgi:hypothetical protein
MSLRQEYVQKTQNPAFSEFVLACSRKARPLGLPSVATTRLPQGSFLRETLQPFLRNQGEPLRDHIPKGVESTGRIG